MNWKVYRDNFEQELCNLIKSSSVSAIRELRQQPVSHNLCNITTYPYFLGLLDKVNE